MQNNFRFTELTHQVDEEMKIEVVVAFQHLNLNDDIHFHYVHVLICRGHSFERYLHDAPSEIEKREIFMIIFI